AAIAPRLSGSNIPAAGAIETLHSIGHRTVGLVWGAASPSAQVTRDAYERIVGDMLARLGEAGPVDGVYLDLHGAMVAEHLDDGEGELLGRIRRIVGPRVPIVASLDLHANVTRAMVDRCDWLVGYRTDKARVETAAAALKYAIADAEGQFSMELFEPDAAVVRAMARGRPGLPVVLADTQDNPGAGGNGDTTGLLAALLSRRARGAVLGLLIDPPSAAKAHAIGAGRKAEFALGEISGVPGHSPLEGEFTVERL